MDSSDRPPCDLPPWLRGLWESLQRASHHVSGDFVFVPHGDGCTVRLRLLDTLPDDACRALRAYIRSYLRTMGWSASQIRVGARELCIDAVSAPAALEPRAVEGLVEGLEKPHAPRRDRLRATTPDPRAQAVGA